MFPQAIVDFYASNQELLWFTTLFVDLGCTFALYRLFGKAGLQVAIAVAIILANLQGPKLAMMLWFLSGSKSMGRMERFKGCVMSVWKLFTFGWW